MSNPGQIKMSQEIADRKNEDMIISIIKRCHDIMYSEEAIVGEKAMHDLMRLLFLRFLEPLIDGGKIDIMDEKYYDEAYKVNIPLLKWSILIKKGNDPDQNNKNLRLIWKRLLCKYPMFSNIFKEDKCFNANPMTLFICIKEINKIELENFKDIKYDVKGEIYEKFINSYMKNGGKELGQFFTNRNYINVICKLLNLTFKPEKKYAVFDPCMGTGGFLTAVKQTYRANVSVHGNDIESDTYIFALMNSILNFEDDFCNLQHANSLHNLEPDKKYDLIMTNPPFGTKIKYDDILGIYSRRYCQDLKNNDKMILARFKTIFPYKVNSGESLFLQLCMFKLKPEGKCAIVLPDGQMLFGSGQHKNIRKYLLDNFILGKVLFAPSGAFEHTNIKTCVFFFKKPSVQKKAEKKNKPMTQKVDFWKTDSECKNWELMGSLTYDKMKANNFSFNYENYSTMEHMNKGYAMSKYEMKTLGEVCDLQIGGTPSRSNSEYWNGDNLWLSIREMDSNIIMDTKEKITQKGISNSNVKLVKEGSILMSFKLSVGKMAIAGRDLYTNEAIVSMNSLDENKLLNIYIYYYLLNHNPKGLSNGIFKNGSLNKASIKSIQIPVPSTEIQREIVEKCKKLREVKIHTEQEIRNIDLLINENNKFMIPHELINSEIETKELGEVCDFKNGVCITKNKLRQGPYPVVGGGKSPMGYHDEYNSKENTILCSSSGASAGYISMYREKVWRSDCFSIEPREIISNEYLYYFLLQKQKYIHTLQSGLAQPHVYSKDLNKIQIPVPAIEVQHNIVEFYKENEKCVDSLKNIQHSLSKVVEQNILICSYLFK